MEIIFQGNHETEEAAESLLSVLKLFKDRYNIHNFREIHLSVTLVDDLGDDVELVDSDTNKPYRVFEVYRKQDDIPKAKKQPMLKLVVNNAHS